MELDSAISLISVGLGILMLIFGIAWARAKALVRELAEALTVLSNALEDDEISSGELRDLISEFQHVVDAARKLWVS
jgi:hypothetical protein